MAKPRLTNKVKEGLWLIVAQSATVMEAELGGIGMHKDDRDAVLAASRYAEAHWGRRRTEDDEDGSPVSG